MLGCRLKYNKHNDEKALLWSIPDGILKSNSVLIRPSQLLFMVPQVPAGIYQMVVVTDISASGNKLKSQVEFPMVRWRLEKA
ncbi:MAG: DUF4469 domain-containing protein [Treponema sp.]|nr:DUF4469 domain-containing protein [Treponema sp.]